MNSSGLLSLSRNGNIMRKTKNITVALTERNYHKARVYAVNHQISVSGLVEFFLENLPLLSQAIRNLVAKDPNFGNTPLRRPYQRR
jgi:hypothetical protein